MLMISVKRGGRYVIVRVKGECETPVRNWRSLEADAKRAVMSQNGHAVRHCGLYDCPAELAARAK